MLAYFVNDVHAYTINTNRQTTVTVHLSSTGMQWTLTLTGVLSICTVKNLGEGGECIFFSFVAKTRG